MISERLPGHRAKDFIRFLKRIDRNVTRHLDVHVVCNKFETHSEREIEAWLERHKRFKVHFTPTPASWLNLVERLFAKIVSQRIARGVFKSVVELKGAIDVNGLVVAGAPYLVKFFRSYSDPKHRPRPRPSHAGETRPARAPR